ncbi:bacterio-opsin activator domain-containing protein [Halomarina oriensis]|uniref:PAS domain-containing protein n=1 Tax=Halomarina oriensis TaxID=671145 RepID=A0A6B0GKV5_9EURY|nr:PAS domain-containing protein [Halomarina oriensis]
MTESSVLYGTPDPTSNDAETTLSTLRAALEERTVSPVTTVEGCRAELDAGDVGAVVVTDAFSGTTATELLALVRETDPGLHTVWLAADPSADAVDAAYDAGVTTVVDRQSGSAAHIVVGALRNALGDPTPVERPLEEDPPVDPTPRETTPAHDWSEHAAILDTISDGVYALDSDERFVAVNDAYAELTGFSREELLGERSSTVTDRIGGDAIDGLREALDETSDAVTFEADLPTVDGRAVPIEARVSPFTTDAGDVGRVGVVRDVSERRRLERELDGILERVTDAFFAIDTDWRFTYVNERAATLLERPASDLVGAVLWEAFPEAVGTAFETEYERARRTGESVTFEEYYPPLEAWFEVNAYPSETGLSVYFRDVSDRKRADQRREDRVRQFEALNERAQRLAEATTREAVCETVVEAAADVLGLQQSYITLYDEESGELTLTAEADATLSGAASSLFADASSNPVWEAFIQGEEIVRPDFDPVGEVTVGSLAAFPLGEHGVFVTLSPRPDAFEETDLLAAELLCANARSSLDRAAREADLRQQRDRLEAKNDRLERVNRINRAIREITRVLVQADSHEEVERLVCEKLATIDPFRFVWFGRHDGATDEVRPVASAGDGKGYLTDVTVTADDAPTGRGPAGRAIESGSPAVQNSILRAAEFEPWRGAALSRGFRSCLAVPVQHRDTQYGILSLYADTPNAFEEMEVTVLSELGQSIGYAVNAIERKQALTGDRSVELTLDLPDLDAPLFGFVDGSDGEFHLENAVRRLDGRVHLFFTASGIAFERIRPHADASPTIERLTHLSSTDDTCRFECTARESTFVSTILDRGAVFERVDVDDGAATVTLRVPRTTDVRGLVGYLEGQFGRVELVSRHERDEPVRSSEAFEGEVRSRLTDRQSEVLETAYSAGFFEWPRKSNGQEVAELLGVTQPTVNRHLRAAERSLFGLLFGD